METEQKQPDDVKTETLTDKDWEQKITAAKAPVVEEQPTEVKVEEKKIEVPVTTEDVEEEVKESSLRRSKRNVGRFIKLHNGTAEEASASMDDVITNPEDMNIELKDEDSYMHNLASAIVAQTTSKQFTLLKEALADVVKSNKLLSSSVNELSDKITNKRPKADGPRELIGREAVMASYAKSQGLRKVFLLNSGFHVVIRAMSMAELHSFYTSIDLEAKEYGRILGGFFYMIEDLFIKQKFMDLLPDIVVDSNLINWSKANALSSAISLHDYDTLLWAICSLQYRTGIEIDLVCTNLECKHMEREYVVDVNKLRYNIQDNIPKEAMEFLLSKDKVKASSLITYRNDYLDFNRRVVINDEAYCLKVPTMREYLTHGEFLISNMASIVKDKLNVNNKNTLTAMIINVYRMLTPWIERIEFLDEDGKKESWTRDQEAIHSLLEVDRHEDTDFNEQVKKFIKDTKLTYICYTGMECPKCHKRPGMAVEDYYPIDMQHFFFYLSCRQLELTGTL